MGIKERHERERETRRRAILDAARDLFVAEGYKNVSMRKIAERIEYSPAALYSYFPSKDDIFFALAEEGFERLFELGRQTPHGPTPLDTLRNHLLNVYTLSVQAPEHYSLMFLDRSVPRVRQYFERFPHLAEMREVLSHWIAAAVAAGQLPATVSPYTMVKLLFSAIHGAAVTQLCNRIGPGEDGEALARDAIDLTLAGFNSGLTLRFAAHHYLTGDSDCPAAGTAPVSEAIQQ
jgi:AcrR family transcriptional regulator